jgi:hypothetical protein
LLFFYSSANSGIAGLAEKRMKTAEIPALGSARAKK